MEDVRNRDAGAESEAASFGSTISDLIGEVGTLVRQEVDIARCEVAAAADEAKGGAVKCGMGFGVGVSAVMAWTAAAVLGLTLLLQRSMPVLPAACVSSAIVGVVLGIVAFALFRQGSKDFQPGHFVPRRAIETLKEDVRWAREQI
ncbi:MAG: phage holin family protein [Planctomycetaceae bacterium]|nr:phage holin family protein [Planctomycetaceae bacterium]